MLGKCGRIEDDEVVGKSPLDAREATWILEKIESIGSIGAMTWIAWEIQFHIGIGDTDSLLRYIDGMNQFRPTTHGIERKAARIAEHVEHTASTSEMLDESTVLALIDEETGLLPLEPIDMELQTILEGHIADGGFEGTSLCYISHRLTIDDQITIYRFTFSLSLLTCLSLITQRGL